MALLDYGLAQVSFGGIACFIIAIYVLNVALQQLRDPLKDVPGPFQARFTRLWLMRQYVKGDFQKTNIELHERHGPIVRIAPNTYSIDSPEAAKIIYGHGTPFLKSDWYIAWGNRDANIFNNRDPHTHSLTRRKVSSAYSMSSVVSYESCIDECTAILLQRLSEFSSSGVVFDLGHWLQCYAFETIGMITFSKRFGFLDEGEDIRGIMAQIEVGTLYASVVGLFSSWHRIFLTAQEKFTSGAQGLFYVQEYAREMIASRKKEKPSETAGPTDFITKFLTIQRESPEKMPDHDLFVAITANIAAGSDTTSTTLSAILYHLIRNPEILGKLKLELAEASRDGRASDPITLKEAQELPYLQAVIKEGLRMHSAVAFTLPRVVPKGGTEILGKHFREGAVVGINPWVAHRNRSVFGNDANLFRPERWLEDKTLVSQREACFLSFGLGSRTCLGKNISLLEISKAIPQVVRHVDFELQHEGDWNVVTHWFAKPKNFTCRAKLRES